MLQILFDLAQRKHFIIIYLEIPGTGSVPIKKLVVQNIPI